MLGPSPIIEGIESGQSDIPKWSVLI